MDYLIAFYQRIVELWCHAKNFPNAPRTAADNGTFCTALLNSQVVMVQHLQPKGLEFDPRVFSPLFDLLTSFITDVPRALSNDI